MKPSSGARSIALANWRGVLSGWSRKRGSSATPVRRYISEMAVMAFRICHHCKQRLKKGEPHDCWTTTEAALTEDLSEDLDEAWKRLRETAVSFGEQRVYASGKAIMFSRKTCYSFV